MAFGDNGKRKKTAFEKLTLVIVLLMAFITIASLVLGAITSIMQ